MPPSITKGSMLLALLCACLGDRGTPDDRIVVLIPNPAVNPDPRFTVNSYDTKLSGLLCPGLTWSAGEGLQPALRLAESITRVDDLTWDVVVRSGLRFSDGRPVRAADVEFTYQSAMGNSRATARKPLVERFVSVTALDQRRVRFRLKAPLATLQTDLEFGIVSQASADPYSGRFDGGAVVCAGPFRIVELGQERVLLDRNPFHVPQARIAEVELRLVADQNAQALMLAGGSADLSQNVLRPDLIDDIDERDGIQVTAGKSSLLSFMMLHNEHRILRDVRVRRAIAHAIDRETIVSAKFEGRAVLASGLLPPLHWAYNGQVDRYPYDPERAMALLDEAGLRDPDGPGGAPRFGLTYKTSADQFRVAVAHIIAQQLGQVGIEVEVRAFEFGTLLADLNAGNFELATMQSVAITDPDYLFTYYNSTRIPTPKEGMHNRYRYRSQQVDELTVAGRNQLDRARRRQLYGEVQAILARDLPVIPLWHEDNIAVMRHDVVGYQVNPTASFAGLAEVTKLR